MIAIAGITGLFLVCLAAIIFSGFKLTVTADELADKTGWGEAVLGVVFIGATTSLSGSVLSLVSSWQGHAELAVSNAVGGIAVQTAFLAVADIFYRKANLEHAAASQENLMQAVFLIILLALPLLAVNSPNITFGHIHPVTPLMFAAYGWALYMISLSHAKPMWAPRMTRETRLDKPGKKLKNSENSLLSLWIRFVLYAAVVASAGWILSKSGILLTEMTHLSETLVGGLFTSVTTSVPELIVAVTAVRRGALTLAVGDIVGGNIYDTLIIAASDLTYREGSIYHAVQGGEKFLMSLTILLAGFLLTGLLHREKHGIANIGFESVLILICYAAGCMVLFLK